MSCSKSGDRDSSSSAKGTGESHNNEVTHGEGCSNSCCIVPVHPSVCQNLDELDFERGLWQAALDNDVQRISHLISYQKTDPDVLDAYGYTALHYAARNGRIEAVKCLLKHGANVNLQTRNNGATPLQRAVTANKIEMVKYLLENGADPSIRDLDGLNAIDRAIRDSRTEIVDILQVYLRGRSA